MTASLVLVVPLAPATTGNGLAMRAGMLLECLAGAGPVDLVVAPVSGSAALSSWARSKARRAVVVDLPTDARTAREHTLAQLGDPTLRTRLEQTQPLPHRARLVPPSLAPAVAAELGVDDARVVVTFREYLVPFGLWLARELRADRVVVDLDDDAEHVLRQLGDDAEADAYGRLARTWLGEAQAVTAASESEARSMTQRYDVEVLAMPNAVRPPVAQTPRPHTDGLLFVGNLTYEPNVEAATRLVEDVLPLVREDLPSAHVTLVGAHDGRVLGLGDRPDVTIAGAVDEVSAAYAQADLVVIPLRSGAGTRIKVLEAMAHGRPMVASSTAVAGLDLRDGLDVVVRDDATAMARAVVGLLQDAGRWSEVAATALATVTRDHTVDAVAPLVRRIVLGHADRSRPGDNPRE